jgi:hypothetical protein
MSVKIDLRIVPTQAARDALARDAVIASTLDLDQIALVLDAEDEPFARLVEVTRDTPGSLFYSMLRFEDEELAAAALLQPQCRKVVRETDRDYRLNNERIKAMEPVLSGGDFETKLLDEIALTKLNLKPGTIAGIGEWTIEYVTTSAVLETFRKTGLTGLEERPVLNPRSKKPHEGYWQLYSKSLMPPLVRQGSVRRLTSEKGPEVSFRQLGCLFYPQGTTERAKDFNRTAEPFTWFGGPDWVVTTRVREVYAESEMKGWEFLPVLEEGTPLHRDFTTRWARVRERVAVNPRNVL